MVNRSLGGACLALMLTLSSVYMLSTGGHVYSVDEETILATTRALVHGRRQLVIPPGNEPVMMVEKHRSGEPVGRYGIGTSVIALPGLALGTAVARVARPSRPEIVVRLFVLVTNSFVTAATAVVLFLLCLELGASKRGALLLALAFGLGTCAWSHAKTLFSEPPVALLLTLSVLFALRWATSDKRKLLLLSGLAGGAALLFRVNSVIYLPLVMLFIGASGRVQLTERLRRALLFGAGVAPMAVVLGATNWWRYGSPFDSGYRNAHFNVPIYEGTLGQLLSPGKGLAFYAPVTVLTVAVLFVVRGRRAQLFLLYGLFLVNLLFFAQFSDWDGGSAWGPRTLEPVIPVLIATLATVVDRVRWRQWIAGLAVLGAGLTLSAGVATYFVAIGWRDLPRLEAELHSTPATDPDAFLGAGRWVPHDSPIVTGLRYLPEAVRHTGSRIGGPAEPLPTATERFVHFYDTPLQLDQWWAWWLPSGGWAPLLLLIPVMLAGAGIGGRRLVAVWRGG